MMVPQQIRSWILLSIRKEGGDLTSIFWSADGINKTIPLLEEMNDAVGWLKAAGLITQKNSIYQRTENANKLIVEHDKNAADIFELWEALANYLDQEVKVTIFEPGKYK